PEPKGKPLDHCGGTSMYFIAVSKAGPGPKKANPSSCLLPAFTLSLALSAAVPVARAEDPLPTAKPEQVGMSSERLRRVSQRMQEYIDKGQVAGTVTLIARQGKVVHFEAQGFRNREEKVPLQKDDIFVIMSMTKPIASTALMLLHEEGKFLLNDPV